MPMKLLKGKSEDDLVYQNDLEEGVWYRRVRDRNTAHLWSGHEVDTHCGLSLWLDEDWWAMSVWEEELGEQWLIRDTRLKGKRCSLCASVKEDEWIQQQHQRKTQAWKPAPSTTRWPTHWWERGTHTSRSSPSNARLLHSWYTVRGWEDPSAPF